MEILEHDEERPVAGAALDKGAHRAEHAAGDHGLGHRDGHRVREPAGEARVDAGEVGARDPEQLLELDRRCP